jgi:5'(3')-deoxyribonucleotidase
MIEKKVLLIDMDGVLVDFEREVREWHDQMISLIGEDNIPDEEPDMIPNIFKDPKPINGSLDAIKKLEESGKYEMVIVTTAPWGNPQSSSHKREWIEKYFGDLFKKQMIVTHRKDLIYGDYLIDDRLANGAGNFKGELLRFGYDYENDKMNEYPSWDSILKKLL